jgi:hypothetical protein
MAEDVTSSGSPPASAGTFSAASTQSRSGTTEPYPLSPESVRAPSSASFPSQPSGRGGSVTRVPVPAATRRTGVAAEGVICLLVAGAWAIAAQRLYSEIGTMIFLRGINQAIASGFTDETSSNTSARSAGAQPRPGATPEPPQRFTLFPPDQAPERRPAARGRGEASRGMTGAAPTTAPPRPGRAVFRPDYAEATRIVWALTTFGLIGLIGVAGAAALFRGMGGRLFVHALTCMAFGAAVGGLAIGRFVRPGLEGGGWLEWMVDITQGRYAWAGHAAVATGVAAFIGLFALRPGSRPVTWVSLAVAAMVLGTFLTLLGISVLERYARFPSQPAWVYVGVAFVQSFFAWVLLLIRGRGPVHTETEYA